MKVDVYDAYVHISTGHRMHFDVFLPAGCGAGCDEKAAEYARVWLHSIGIEPENMQLEQCRYCHSETVREEARIQLVIQGYFILPMEGCRSDTH